MKKFLVFTRSTCVVIIFLAVPYLSNSKEVVPAGLEEEILIKTLLSEAGGGQPIEGLVEVANVIRNRSIATGQNPIQVVLKDKQFSFWNAFNSGGRNWSNQPILSSKLYETEEQRNLATDLAKRLLDGRPIPGYSSNSTMFYNPEVANPWWAKLLTDTHRVGDHVFGVIPGEYGR